jgi:hypothetical protein
MITFSTLIILKFVMIGRYPGAFTVLEAWISATNTLKKDMHTPHLYQKAIGYCHQGNVEAPKLHKFRHDNTQKIKI